MIIDLFFAILNLGTLVALLFYAAWKYGIPYLREMIIKDFHAFNDLRHTHEQLIVTQNMLEESITQQENTAKYLFKKVNHWRNVVELENEARRVSYEKTAEALREKASIQAENYGNNRLYRSVAPRVIAILEHDLGKIYENHEKGHEYIASFIKDLKKHTA